MEIYIALTVCDHVDFLYIFWIEVEFQKVLKYVPI